MACRICESRISAGDCTKNRIIHLTAATIKEKNRTFSREKRLNILSDLIITRISAVEARAQVMPMKVVPYPRLARWIEKKP